MLNKLVHKGGDACRRVHCRLHKASLFMRLPILFVIAFLCVPAGADFSVQRDLPRRADPGFSVSGEGEFLMVKEVVAGSPAHQAGLLRGDIIAAVNGRAYDRDFEGRDLLRRLDGGANVELTLERDSEELKITFVPAAVPFTDTAGIHTVYDGFATSDGSRLRTALSYRQGLSGPLPVVALIQWVSCGVVTDKIVPELQTVVETLPVVIYRVERSSNGDSKGRACHELDYNSEIRHYSEALLDLGKSPAVDRARMYLYGSSLGSTVTPLVAQALKRNGLQVAGLMVQGGGAVT